MPRDVQLAEQAAINEEAWASHAALEARVAKTEEVMLEAGQGAIKDASHVFASTAFEKRFGESCLLSGRICLVLVQLSLSLLPSDSLGSKWLQF